MFLPPPEVEHSTRHFAGARLPACPGSTVF